MMNRNLMLLFLMISFGCKPSVQYVGNKKQGADNTNNSSNSNGTNGSSNSGDSTGNGEGDGESDDDSSSGGTNPGSGLTSQPVIKTTVTDYRTKSSITPNNISVESSDPNLTYAWSTTAGPGPLVFIPNNALKPSITANQDGKYVATLTVTNSVGESSSLSINIIWDTTGPVITLPTDLKFSSKSKVDGASVQDADPAPSLKWSLVTPSTGLNVEDSDLINPSVSSDKDGAYVIRLTATDWLGNGSFKDMVVEKISLGPGPNVVLGPNITTNKAAAASGTVVTPSTASLMWATTSGPSNLTINKTNDLSPTISAPSDGVYVATLTATDANAQRTLRSLVFTWDTTPPNLSLSSPLTISIPTRPEATANDLTALSYLWTQISGPGVLSFSSNQVLQPTISASAAGNYIARLVATDAAGNQSTKDLNLTWIVPDVSAPVITLGPALKVFAPTAPSGISVNDQDKNLSIKWSQIYGPGVLNFNTDTTLMPIISATQPGDYIARLRITDSSNNASDAFLKITWYVNDTTAPQIIMQDPMNISAPTRTNGITIIEDSAYQILWTQVFGPSGGSLNFNPNNQSNTVISANLPGTYIARLTVTDSFGNASYKDLTIVWFIPDNDAPKLSMGPVFRISQPSQPKYVSVSDRDTKLSYQWIPLGGPGTLSFSQLDILYPVISASTPGNYFAALTVKDSSGNSATGILSLVWFIPDTQAPLLSMGSPLYLKVATKLSQIQASDNDPNLTFKWEKISGPGNVLYSSTIELNPTISMTMDGVYKLKLTVTDSAGNSTSGEITITWDTTPPVVFAGANRTAKGDFTIQDASVQDLTPVTLEWRVKNKPSIASIKISDVAKLNPTIQANYPGNFVLDLVATDALGHVGTGSMSFVLDIGYWEPTDGGECPKICSSKGKRLVRSPEGAYCASGENAIASAYPWVIFKYGFWPNSLPLYVSDANTETKYCYRSTQKKDYDQTDITVGCYCIQ